MRITPSWKTPLFMIAITSVNLCSRRYFAGDLRHRLAYASPAPIVSPAYRRRGPSYVVPSDICVPSCPATGGSCARLSQDPLRALVYLAQPCFRHMSGCPLYSTSFELEWRSRRSVCFGSWLHQGATASLISSSSLLLRSHWQSSLFI